MEIIIDGKRTYEMFDDYAKFEVGKNYTYSYGCSYMRYEFEVIKRTAYFITIKTVSGEIEKCKIRFWHKDSEMITPSKGVAYSSAKHDIIETDEQREEMRITNLEESYYI